MKRLAERISGRAHLVSAVAMLLCAIPVIYWFGASDYYSRIIAAAGLMTIVVMGLNVLSGLGGQLSLGHAGFYAIGAYTAAIFTVKLGLPLLLGIAVGVLFAAFLGLLLAIPALRVSGPYLAMVTLAFGMISYQVAVNFPPLTGGAAGLFPVPKLQLFGVTLNLEMMNYGIAVLVAAGMYSLGSLLRSRWGRALRAISGNQIAAASSGVPVVRGKRFAFVLSATLAGLAGGIYASVNGFVNPDPFHFELSIVFLTMLMVGGSGTLWGPVVGVILMTVIERALAAFPEARHGAYAIVLLVILRFMPEGVVGSCHALVQRLRGKAGDGRAASGDARTWAEERFPLRGAANSEHTSALLQLTNVSRGYGKLQAVNDVSLVVTRGTIHALVGPNGAGKTTLFNLISGVDRPQTGSILLAGREIGGIPAHKVAELGLARTFQNLALFDELSVLDNVLIGSHLVSSQGYLDALMRTPRTAREERELADFAHEILRFVQLDEWAKTPAGALPQGQRRRLELARALAARPQLLLLDEPAAGLNPAEAVALGELIENIRAHGITVVLVEHHMKLVMKISDRVTVLDSGRVIAEGTPKEVQAHPRVIEAYLGSSRSAGKVSRDDA